MTQHVHVPRETDSVEVRKFAERIRNYVEGAYDVDDSYAVDIMEDMLSALRGESYTNKPLASTKSPSPELSADAPMNQWKEFEIWSEGFSATGERAPHSFVGTARGRNFAHACQNYADYHPEWAKNFTLTDGKPAHWACRLFDNERDASKAFG